MTHIARIIRKPHIATAAVVAAFLACGRRGELPSPA